MDCISEVHALHASLIFQLGTSGFLKLLLSGMCVCMWQAREGPFISSKPGRIMTHSYSKLAYTYLEHLHTCMHANWLMSLSDRSYIVGIGKKLYGFPIFHTS